MDTNTQLDLLMRLWAEPLKTSTVEDGYVWSNNQPKLGLKRWRYGATPEPMQLKSCPWRAVVGLEQHFFETQLKIQTPDVGAWSRSKPLFRFRFSNSKMLRFQLWRRRVHYSVRVNPFFNTCNLRTSFFFTSLVYCNTWILSHFEPRLNHNIQKIFDQLSTLEIFDLSLIYLTNEFLYPITLLS